MPEEMNSTESVALEALAPTLQKLALGRRKATLEAINSATGLAILAKNRKTSARAIELLGEFAGLQPKDEETRDEILTPQRISSSKIAGIALVLKDPDVDNASLTALERRLKVTALGKGEAHAEALIDIAIIAMQSEAKQKEKACSILGEYAHKPISHRGYVGKDAFPETQAMAEQLIGYVGIS